MSNLSKSKLKKIKCRTCGRGFKVGKTDFESVIADCPANNCDLRSKDYERLIEQARKVVATPVLTEDMFEVVIPDPIVIIVDQYGNNKRTLP